MEYFLSVCVVGFIISLVILISRDSKCPECGGKLVDWNLHNSNPLTPIRKCVNCKKEWL